MESHLQKSPTDSSDAKYVSGLSTILVATIQEAKDRISQIEYIFCSQLVPTFQLKFQNLQKSHSESIKVAELAYKEKENDLLLQITRIQSEKQQILEGNHLLKLEIEKFTSMENQSCNHVKKLQEELKQRMVEVNEGRETQKNMQKLLESNASLMHSYENTTKDLEDRVTMLLKKQKTLEVENEELRLNLMQKSNEVDEVMKLEKKVDEMRSALREKTEAVDKGMEVQRNLLKKIEYQDSEITNNEQKLSKREKDNIRLASNIENLVNHVDELQKLVANKNTELEEGRKVQEQLLKQIDSSSTGRMKRGNEFYEYENENEKKLLLDKQKDLEEKVNKLQLSLYERSKESSEGMELHVKLLQQIEAKDSKLKSEKQKMLTLMSSYKNLKSQYRYLCQKHGHTPETMLPSIKKEDGTETEGDNQSPIIFLDIENTTSKATEPEGEQEILENDKRVVHIPRSSPISPSMSSILITPKCQSTIKSCPLVGAKRPISHWRDTRSNQSRVGPDLHDDFLDTPLENVRRNSGKIMKDESSDHPKPGPNVNFDNSDDETQCMNVDPVPEKEELPPQKAGPSGFKYVEPVRKKSERENLKGVQCKQCKKFYDAVLPEEGKNSDGSKQNIRCEHHDGVSRHRYRYAPPLTPEGFWNIGFESEM